SIQPMNENHTQAAQALAAGYEAFQRDDDAGAWRQAQKAVALYPDAFDTQMFAATAALSAREHDKALAHFDEAFKRAPHPAAQATVWQGIGRTHMELANGDQAAQAFQRGLALAPRNPALRTDFGRAL